MCPVLSTLHRCAAHRQLQSFWGGRVWTQSIAHNVEAIIPQLHDKPFWTFVKGFSFFSPMAGFDWRLKAHAAKRQTVNISGELYDWDVSYCTRYKHWLRRFFQQAWNKWARLSPSVLVWCTRLVTRQFYSQSANIKNKKCFLEAVELVHPGPLDWMHLMGSLHWLPVVWYEIIASFHCSRGHQYYRAAKSWAFQWILWDPYLRRRELYSSQIIFFDYV